MKFKPIIFLIVFSLAVVACAQVSDSALRRIRELDAANRDDTGRMKLLPVAEHLERADAYSSNRLFPQAREHWAMVIDNYPGDAGIPRALLGIGRSYMWERKYDVAVEWFERLTKSHLAVKEGREGLAFKGASFVRLGKNLEAVKAYEQYVSMFPAGERIDSAHLNIIDAYREAGNYDEANRWVDKTVETFKTTPTEINALHARLRMEIFRGHWAEAIAASDELLALKSFKATMTSADEVNYLKAIAAEHSGNRPLMKSLTTSIPQTSYFGGLIGEKLAVNGQAVKLTTQSPQAYADFPVPFRAELLHEAGKRKIDPRFLLAIMKQESVFKSDAKSPAGARGLLQLVYDTAIKYKDKAGFPGLQPDDLYTPTVNIAIGAEYVADLKNQFGGLYEGIAASYNGGEDNADRWLNRTKPRDPGIFTAEVGFSETKNYVIKVMNNYRTYKALYNERLERS